MSLKNTGILLQRKFENEDYKKISDVKIINNYDVDFKVGDKLIFELTSEFLSEAITDLDDSNHQYIFAQDTDDKMHVGLIFFESKKAEMVAIHNSWLEDISLRLVITPERKPVFLGVKDISQLLTYCDGYTYEYLIRKYGL